MAKQKNKYFMKKIVVKVGSSIIAPGGKINPVLISALAGDILDAQKQGCRIILVTSGAIACGANKLGLTKKPSDIHILMALASLGQIILMDAYSEAFAKYDKSCAQILLSWDDFDSRKRFLNARKTIDKLLEMGVIPVINENDAVSDDEIKFGDNDRLSALVGDLAGAEIVVILSDVEGLLDRDGKVIPVVDKIDKSIYDLVRSEDKKFTSGGMRTKLEAAEVATAAGTTLSIVSGQLDNVVSRFAAGGAAGTSFLPAGKINNARKRWIAFSKKAKGKIHIDDGAKDAIINRGKSLLCVGVTKVEGDFKKKDSVKIVDGAGNVLGCGIVNYSCEELGGCSLKKLDKEVIHRDNFVKTL